MLKKRFYYILAAMMVAAVVGFTFAYFFKWHVVFTVIGVVGSMYHFTRVPGPFLEKTLKDYVVYTFFIVALVSTVLINVNVSAFWDVVLR